MACCLHAKCGLLRSTSFPPPHRPASSWANQVVHVQRMLNNSPSTALNNMTRSWALYGAPDQTVELPSVATITSLLGFAK